jgi:hypothetical protein
MSSATGVYWSVMHRRAQDYDYFKRLQPAVFKIMDGGQPDYQFARDHLPNSLVVARDWALSEQHSDMLKDPIATGTRHAREWRQHADRLGFDRAKTLVLGINEPQVWNPGVPEALRLYTIAMCEEGTRQGLRVGAMQLSVGWPANTGADTPPNWEPFRGVDNAIRANNGALVLHEYWADNGPGEMWGWWGGRSLKCPWQVPIIIGECGVDMYVKDGSVPHNSRGWRGRMEPERYARELAEYATRMSVDPRFVGNCVFASDFANHEWYSFDVEPAYAAILATPAPSTKHDTFLPIVGTPPQPVAPPSVPPLTHPIADPNLRAVSQPFGVNPDRYARFGMAGHNGVDYAVPEGTPIRAVDDGVVVEVGNDPDGYGLYVKMRHAWGESLYAHLGKQLASDMDVLGRNRYVGLSGNTGNSTGPHLHFGMRVNPYQRGWPFDGYTDPLPYLSGATQPSPQPAPLLPLIKAAAQEFGIEWQLLASQAWAESSFDPRAVSSAGAQGLMQIMPATWAEWSAKVGGGNDPFDARQNLRVGAAYMQWLLKQTGGKVYDALVAYGWGIGNLLRGESAEPFQWAAYANKVIHGRDLLKAVA